MHTSAKEVPADDCWSRFSFLANFSASSSGANLLPLALLLTRLCVFRFCVHFWLRSVCLQLIILPSYLQLRVEYDTFTRRCMPGIRQKQIVCSNEDGDDAGEFFTAWHEHNCLQKITSSLHSRPRNGRCTCCMRCMHVLALLLVYLLDISLKILWVNDIRCVSIYATQSRTLPISFCGGNAFRQNADLNSVDFIINWQFSRNCLKVQILKF